MNKLIPGLMGSRAQTANTNVAAILEGMGQLTAGRSTLIDSKTATSVATEGFGSAAVAGSVESLVTSLAATLAQARQTQKLSVMTPAQESAAVTAGFYGSAVKSYLNAPLATASNMKRVASENTVIIDHADIPGASDVRVGVEAYDERINTSAMKFSVAYNMECSRQNAFGELFYPTVVVTPDSVGYNVSVRLIFAYSEVQRAASGALSNFNRQNIIRAIIDATILAVDQTKLIPVYRASGGSANTGLFATGIAATTLTVDGKPLPTAPLATGVSFDLLALSQTDAMLAQGLEDQTDAIDSSVRLAAIYVEVDGPSNAKEFFRFETQNLPLSDFQNALQGNTRLLQLNFATESLSFASTTKQVDGSASTLLAALGTNTARLTASLSGNLLQDVGTTTVNAFGVAVKGVFDSTGNALDTATGTGQTVAAVFAGAKVVGYDLLAYRTNSNRRNRGKLLDIQHINYLYTVPLLPPVSALRPVTETEANDGQLLSNLVTATRYQTANGAVTALLNAQALLKQYAAQPDTVLTQPKLFGVSAALVTPYYDEKSLDVATAIDSLSTSQRALDLQSLLMNKLRDMATIAWVQSGYGAAAEAMYEGQPPKPLVIIGCDPVLYRYLTLTGDLRLLGDMFDYKIVYVLDSRMQGKIVFSFGNEASLSSGVPDPLHFGNMAWRPELTVMLPMVRNGAQSMELTVQPSFRHVNNLPIMGVLNVSNISAVIGGKVSLNVQNHVV